MNRLTIVYCGTMAILAATLVTKHAVERRPTDTLKAPLSSIPASIGGWTARGSHEFRENVLALLRPTEVLSRAYGKGDQQLALFISYYAQQRAGESMHSPKNCLPGSGWEIWKLGSATIPYEEQDVEVNHFSIQNAGRRMLMIYWYQSKRRIIANEYAAKLLLVRDALLDGQTAGSIVRITAVDTPEMRSAALDFAALVMPEVQRCMTR